MYLNRTICLIVAMDRRGAIGRGGEMPWHLPADLGHFKQTTLGHPIIMGRKTFEAIGRPLPGRQNVVVTRDREYNAPGIDIAHDLDRAIELADDDTVFVIGGGEIYRQAIRFADRLVVTEVDATVEDADAWFPEIDPDQWREIQRQDRPADDRNPYDLSFVVYQRRKSSFPLP